MPPQDLVLTAFVNSTMLLSIFTALYLLAASRRGPLLRHEPRRPVPWNFAAGLLAILMVVSKFAESLSTARLVETPSHHDPQQLAQGLLAGLFTEAFVTGGFLFIVAALSKANRADLGLPKNTNQFQQDLVTGLITCLAALAPVLILQLLLTRLFFPHIKVSGHPLIKALMSGEPSTTLLIVAGVYAVIVAPICEEIVFRLLLQGWLEKIEDVRLGWRTIPVSPPIASGEVEAVEPAVPISQDFPLQMQPPRYGLAGLPYGWFPILMSGMLFGIAHYGYGPDPIPLVLLGFVLGYLYQRTHRIIPGIVTHALFNSFSMVTLWRMLFHAN